MVPVRPLIAFAARVLSRPRSADRRTDCKRSTRLGVEVLEDRRVLSLITVTNPNDSGEGSLRWAVEEANRITGVDTIDFDPAVFIPGIPVQLSSGQLSLTDTTGTTTIDGHDASVTILGTSHSRVFSVGVGVSAVFSALTISGGHAVYNGSDYMTGNGGGIYNLGDLKVSGCVLTSNTGSNDGGGIYNALGSRLTVSDGTTVSYNSANFGGGIASRGELTVSGSNVSYNSSTSYAGGIGNAAGVLTVSVSTISHNTAVNEGGGIYNSNALTVSASTLSYNSARDGGGIFTADGSVTVSKSTVSGNSVSTFGGGIYVGRGNVTVSESTIVFNSATDGGGIVSCSPPDAVTILHNDLIARNFVRNSNPLSPVDLLGTLDASSSYNLIGDGSGALDVARGNLLGTLSNPLDPMLGSLQNNGGRTWTHALLAGSPAINTGDPAILSAPELYDQRGLGFARVVGRIDIGAFEVQVLTSHYLAVTANGIRDLVSQGALPPGVSKSLAAKVEVARDLLNRGNTTPVVKMLHAFIAQVVGLRKAGKLAGAEAQYLIDTVQWAIGSMEAG